MRIGIPIWNDRISPVFDTARHLLVVEVGDGKEAGREEHILDDLFPPLRVRRLKEIGVEMLICGAISNPIASLIETAGIELVPWVSGSVNEVIDAFSRERLAESRYRMPGCRRGKRGFRGGMRHGRRGESGRRRGGGGAQRRGRQGWRKMKGDGNEDSGDGDGEDE